jgi:hypothetical protein
MHWRASSMRDMGALMKERDPAMISFIWKCPERGI